MHLGTSIKTRRHDIRIYLATLHNVFVLDSESGNCIDRQVIIYRMKLTQQHPHPHPSTFFFVNMDIDRVYFDTLL